MAFVELRLNRYQQPVRYLNTRKTAEDIVRAWVNTSPDGSPESLVQQLDDTLRQILVSICDA